MKYAFIGAGGKQFKLFTDKIKIRMKYPNGKVLFNNIDGPPINNGLFFVICSETGQYMEWDIENGYPNHKDFILSMNLSLSTIDCVILVDQFLAGNVEIPWLAVNEFNPPEGYELVPDTYKVTRKKPKGLLYWNRSSKSWCRCVHDNDKVPDNWSYSDNYAYAIGTEFKLDIIEVSRLDISKKFNIPLANLRITN